MDKQLPLNLPSVQVTYRIFLRDMLPGWISGMAIAYGLAPILFQETTLIVATFLLTLIWSPIIGLLVNTLGYIFFEWALESSFSESLFKFFFRANSKSIESFGKKTIKLVYGASVPDNESMLLLKELKQRCYFLFRATGWSEKDELAERLHGLLQTARSLSFMCFVLAILFGNSTIRWYGSDIKTLPVLVVAGFVFLLIAIFLTQYSKVVDIRLLYELILVGGISPTVVKGELPPQK
jgi:hypothetical protein